jgi:hypothetical protein
MRCIEGRFDASNVSERPDLTYQIVSIVDYFPPKRDLTDISYRGILIAPRVGTHIGEQLGQLCLYCTDPEWVMGDA